MKNSADRKYRLYVDESGNADYPKKNHTRADLRYLSLTGIAISENECANALSSKIDNMKYLLTGDYDEKFTLHRDEIKERKGIYSSLNDPEIEAKWNYLIEDLIRNTNYTLFCVVIDKSWHRENYPSPNHPYYYCLEVLLERYIRFLDSVNGRGDVMFESRGRNEDNELRKQYGRIFTYGNRYMPPSLIQRFLTSKDIKLKNKTQMIAGLEFADLLALVTKLDTLSIYGHIDHISSKFMQEMVAWVKDKYYERGVKGYGRKLLGEDILRKRKTK